jgi:hypothetical protein
VQKMNSFESSANVNETEGENYKCWFQHPTQLTVHLYDNSDPNHQVEIACVIWQLQFTKDGKFLTAAHML